MSWPEQLQSTSAREEGDIAAVQELLDRLGLLIPPNSQTTAENEELPPFPPTSNGNRVADSRGDSGSGGGGSTGYAWSNRRQSPRGGQWVGGSKQMSPRFFQNSKAECPGPGGLGGGGERLDVVQEGTVQSQVDLSQRGITAREAVMLSPTLQTAQGVQCLKLCYNHLRDDGAAAVAAAIEKHVSLHTLDLGFNGIGDSGALSLARSLRSNTSLRTLYLSGNSIGTEGARALASALQQANGITTLHLTGNSIGPEGACALAEALKSNSSLQRLYINGGGIKATGACAMAAALAGNRELSDVYVSDNDIGDEGLFAVSKALVRNRSVRLLELGFNRITAVGVEALAKSMWGYTALKNIQLDNNQIGDRGAQLVAAVLPTLSLETLGLGFNKICMPGVSALMQAVLQCSSLTSVGLSGNALDTEAAKAIALALAQPGCALRELSLDHASLGRAGEGHITAGLLSNRSLTLRTLTGFRLGAAFRVLGMPQQVESYSNEQALDHVRAFWKMRMERSGKGSEGKVHQPVQDQRHGPPVPGQPPPLQPQQYLSQQQRPQHEMVNAMGSPRAPHPAHERGPVPHRSNSSRVDRVVTNDGGGSSVVTAESMTTRNGGGGQGAGGMGRMHQRRNQEGSDRGSPNSVDGRGNDSRAARPCSPREMLGEGGERVGVGVWNKEDVEAWVMPGKRRERGSAAVLQQQQQEVAGDGNRGGRPAKATPGGWGASAFDGWDPGYGSAAAATVGWPPVWGHRGEGASSSDNQDVDMQGGKGGVEGKGNAMEVTAVPGSGLLYGGAECSPHADALRAIAQIPFDGAELWALHQFYFSPPPNPDPDSQGQGGAAAKVETEENGVGASHETCGGEWNQGADGVDVEAPLQAEDAALGALGSAAARGRGNGVNWWRSSSPPPPKRLRNSLTKTRIAHFPRVKAQVDKLQSNGEDSKVLTLLRQLKHLQAAVVAAGGGVEGGEVLGGEKGVVPSGEGSSDLELGSGMVLAGPSGNLDIETWLFDVI